PVAGNFSITVVDETKTPFDDNSASTIFSNLLLTSDIKGYVEKPNYYFTADNDEVNRALDNLMLTQGYRRFLWWDLKKGIAATLAFKAEGLGTFFSGKVVTLGNKPAANAAVTLMSVRANMVKGTTTDAEGKFKFDGIFLSDSLKFSIQARAQKKSGKVEVILDTVPKLGTIKNKNIAALNTDLYRSTKSYAENGRKQDEVLEKRGGLSRAKRLKEVNIVAKAYQKNLPKQRNYNQNGPGKYDQIIKNEELQSCPNLAACLEGKIAGVIFKNGLPVSTRANRGVDGGNDITGRLLVVLDGVPLSPIDNASTIEAIFQNNDPAPDQIASIEVLRSVNYTNVYGELNGVLLITTKNGGNHAAAYNPSMVNISPKTFDKAKVFYSPRYDSKLVNNDQPDLRSTIYWNPAVKTDMSGKASFKFFAGDGPGIYKVTIEGLNAAGNLGRKVYRFSVQ
ncbi:MAG: TonB-dependent receptor, partial [Pedobacter sp.]